MIEAGSPTPLGAHWDGQGVNFALYSGVAESVELCLFNEHGQEAGHYRLTECTDGVWHGYLPELGPGQRYGYRVHGRYDPEQGLRCNPAKLLIDPYARRLSGGFSWSQEWFDFELTGEDGEIRPSLQDSAPFVPKSVVSGPGQAPARGPGIPWKDTIIYEANVRGFSMAHPAVPEKDRGKFAGLRNQDVLAYLKALGITSLELLPVHAFIDEQFLGRRGLRNFWGYNSLNFFTPESRYAGVDPVAEFRDMVNAVHEAGIEVILDVVYNHTAEGGRDGPTLSFRGIDNLAYYRSLRQRHWLR
jgi:isoamylase